MIDDVADSHAHLCIGFLEIGQEMRLHSLVIVMYEVHENIEILVVQPDVLQLCGKNLWERFADIVDEPVALVALVLHDEGHWVVCLSVCFCLLVQNLSTGFCKK